MSHLTFSRCKVAALSGCNIETVRYYERIGLIPAPKKSSNGYRIYTEDHVSRLCFIVHAKRLGFTNQNIREILNITIDQRYRLRTKMKTLADKYVDIVEQRISDLQSIEEILTSISKRCDGSKDHRDNCKSLLTLFSGKGEAIEQTDSLTNSG